MPPAAEGPILHRPDGTSPALHDFGCHSLLLRSRSHQSARLPLQQTTLIPASIRIQPVGDALGIPCYRYISRKKFPELFTLKWTRSARDRMWRLRPDTNGRVKASMSKSSPGLIFRNRIVPGLVVRVAYDDVRSLACSTDLANLPRFNHCRTRAKAPAWVRRVAGHVGVPAMSPFRQRERLFYRSRASLDLSCSGSPRTALPGRRRAPGIVLPRWGQLVVPGLGAARNVWFLAPLKVSPA